MDYEFHGYTITVPYPENGFTSYHQMSDWFRRNKIPFHLAIIVLPSKAGENYSITGFRDELG